MNNRLLPIVIVLASLFAAPGLSRAAKYTARYDSARAALQSDSLDKAFGLFLRAYGDGMPADSLYYYWAEIYRGRGILDSALALNYAVKEPGTRAFHQRILEQRLAIFRALGWSEQTEAVKDSLRTFPAYRPAGFIPRLSLSASAGNTRGTHLVDTATLWSVAEKPLERRNELYYGTSARLKWPETTAGALGLSWGLRGALQRPAREMETPGKNDSVSLAAGGFLELVSPGDRLSLNCSFTGERDYLGDYRFVPSLQAAAIGLQGALLAVAAYSIDLTDFGTIYSQNAWTFLSWNCPVKTLSLSLLASGFKAEPDVATLIQSSSVWYVDKLTTESQPIFYQDASFSTPIDSSAFRRGIEYAQKVRASAQQGAVQQQLSRSLPLSHFSFRPAVTLERKLPQGIAAATILAWGIHWYPEAYEWNTVKTMLPSNLYYDRQTASYYRVPALSPPRAAEGPLSTSKQLDVPYGEAVTPSATLESHNAIRIDNTLSANLSFKKTWHYVGSLSLGGSVSRTWSTLHDTPIVTIPEFTCTFFLNWHKDLDFVKRL